MMRLKSARMNRLQARRRREDAKFWKFLAGWILAGIGWLLITFVVLDILATRTVP
jgi:Na+/H+ antiporter NhaA